MTSDDSAKPSQTQTSSSTAETAPQIDPALMRKLGEIRQRLHATLAQVVMAMMMTPRYRHCALADLEHLVLEPLLRDRVSVASARGKEEETAGGEGRFAGIAIWARVSAEVDARIREQIKAKVFPLRLKGEDWASGDIVWLFDVIAPTPALATAVLSQFRRTVEGEQMFVHPIVRGLVDPAFLKAVSALDGKAEANGHPLTQ
jgi:hemolysin-activating ACP:hemolysin acyltransferase